MVLGVETDRVDSGAHVDDVVADRHWNVRELLLGPYEHVLPVLEARSSVLQLYEFARRDSASAR